MEKRPRGRPPKSPDERKQDRMIFRLESDERTAIERAARLAGMKVSEWVRARLSAAAKREIKRAKGS